MTRVMILCFVLVFISCSGKPSPERIAASSSIQPTTRTHTFIDTVVTRPLSLYPFLPPQSVSLHLSGPWEDSLHWNLALLAGVDTLVSSSGDDVSDPFDDSTATLPPLEERKRRFIDFMTTLTIDTVRQDDERRDWFQKASWGCFRDYLQPRGYTDEDVNRLHASFWQYYQDKDILMIGLPATEPAGDEKAYAYDPTMKKILPFYRP